MEARLNLFGSPVAAKVLKYLNSAGKAVRDSTCTPRTPRTRGKASSG
jgi:hypothetical protein